MPGLEDIPTSMPQAPPKFWEQLADFFGAQWSNCPQDLPALLEKLNSMHMLHAILLTLAGLLYLILGWRAFKALVMLNAAGVGLVLGGAWAVQLGKPEYAWVGILVGAGVLGILAWPLMKLFVALFGGVVGAAVGLAAFEQVVLMMGRGDLVQYSWAGAIGGAVLLALLAVLVFRAGIMIATAIQGAAMLVAGFLALLFESQSLHDAISSQLLAHRAVLLLVVLGVGLGGLVVQAGSSGREKKANKQKSTSPGDRH